ncbi:LPXTG cell wall anchor domain-containing protein [Streptomyces sp. N2-109]|uniref:LPXTG cell wall anchor domain-containing protein n=1 Tax=Streptomyces gossypii TaxID=2883101 RepID=A0ABT2JXC7_9ACTN|nr:LPXTG cell wall anchor domain-containing protein [Streptomyces gossypii]MCT2592323.1 LPXTG cell wall anchor domain-containing protein [Streptomyces gossypii]
MRIRRALAVAAATAVIAPAALLAAPAAYATTDGGAGDSTSTGETTAGGGDSGGEAAAGADGGSDGSTGETTTGDTTGETTTGEATTGDTSGDATTGGGDDGGADTGETNGGTETDGGADGGADGGTGADGGADGGADTEGSSGEPGTSPSPSPSESEPPLCEDVSLDAKIDTKLIGLPGKVVAGSGWEDFTFRVTNNSDRTMKSVEVFADVETTDGKSGDLTTDQVTLQWFDDEADAWVDISDTLGYFGAAQNLKPGTYAGAKMRLKIDKSAPAGEGLLFTTGLHVPDSGDCEFGEWMQYEFDVLAAGASPGKVDDAKGEENKDKKKANRPTPQGGSKELKTLPEKGELAATGSSSQLPMFALAGGAAIALGAGGMFIVRRRKDADEGAGSGSTA